MRLIRILLIIFLLQLSAHAYCQTKITLNIHTNDFEKIIYAIKKQTGYHFVYNQDKLPKKEINLNVKNQEALTILDQLLKNSEYSYTLLNGNLIVIGPAHKEVIRSSISGRVLDNYGRPVKDATVRIKNSDYGTSTDGNGNFGININLNDTLRISHIGYATKTIALSKNDFLKITLLPDSTNLQEVVVTALNIKKEERKIGYSIAVINGDDLTQAREANMILALEGKVAGLNISGVSGGPSSSARILLRGAASMNASSPLIVLNGVAIDNTQRGSATEYGGADYGDGISNINPDDIETLTVLKGSAASALYGARAANGVILVSTKSGKKNSGTSVEYNLNLSYDQAVNNTDFQYTYGQGEQNKRPWDVQSAIASGLLSWGEKLDGKPTIQFDGNDYPYSAVKDNAAQFYRTAPALTNTIAVSGGSQNSTYRVSASDLTYESILPNSGLDRKTINLNLSHDFTPRLNVNFYENYIREMGKNRSYLSDAPLNANYGIEFLATSARQSSLAPGYNPKTGIETQWNDDEYKTNPYFVINKQVDNADRNRFITATVAKYKFSDNVYLQGRVGYDVSYDNILNVAPTGTAFTVNEQGTLNGMDKSQTSELNADVLFAFNKNLTKDINIDFSAGSNFRKRQYNLTGYTGSQFIIPYVYTTSNLVSVSSNNTVSELVTESAYYTADIDYKHFLDISATGRYDVYSTLPANNRGIFVPGISGSFIFSDLLGLPLLNYGKLRMSYAKTSGEPSQPYTTQLFFSSTNSDNGVPLGDFSRELPNYNLKPFTLNEFESGCNLVFFDSRLAIDFTYFNRITHNEITNAEQSVTTGFTSAYVNVGKTKNTGIELMLNVVPIKLANFSWNTSFNFSHVNNILLSIDGTSQYILTGAYRPLNANTALVTGKSITQIMAYDYKRDAKGNIIIGSDGIPERGDFKPMGGTLPTYYGGITNTFRYKNFNLSFLVDYKFGNKVLSATEDYSYVYGLNKATLVGRETGVVAKGVLDNGSPNTINVAAYNYYPQLTSNISALSVLNGSFIKLRQVTLGYEFKPGIFGKVFQSVAVDLVGRNLFTLLKYTKNIDPESEFSPSLAYAGIEGGSLPAVRTIGINLNFKFK